MENEFQKMQRLAGVPVTEDKKQLDENFVGMSMVGNIFDREKTDYEMAFEHFLGKKYINEDETSMNTDYDGLDPDDYDLMDDGSMVDPETGKIVWSPERGRIKEEEVEEGNLGSGEIYSIEPEGRFWIVSWRGMEGPKEKVFSSEDEAREFVSTLDEISMNEDFGDKTSKTLPKFKDYKEDHPEIYARMVSNFNPTGKNPFFPNLQLDMVDWKRTEEGEDFWEDVYDGRFEDAYNYIKYHGEKKGLDEYGRGKYDRKVGTYKGKYPIYQDDEGNNYIKTGSGIKDVEDLDQSQVKINK
jgi:hypothetical protein